MASLAICGALQTGQYHNILIAPCGELDLDAEAAIRAWFQAHSSEVVVLATAKIAGIQLCRALRRQYVFDAINL